MAFNQGSFNAFRLIGDLLHVASIILLWHKIQSTRSCSGLSLKSQILFLFVYVTRYLDIIYYIFHGPFDLKHLYNFCMKLLFIGSQTAVLYYMWYRFRASYNAKLDTVRLEYLLLPCLVLAFFFKDSSQRGGNIVACREVSLSAEVFCLSCLVLLEIFHST